jgi:hypothetical protein
MEDPLVAAEGDATAPGGGTYEVGAEGIDLFAFDGDFAARGGEVLVEVEFGVEVDGGGVRVELLGD